MSFSDLTLFSLGALLLLAGCSGAEKTVVVGADGGGPFSDNSSSSSGDPTSSSSSSSSSSSGDPDTSTPASASDLVVFTTKASFQGDFGGLAGADTRCTTYANAAGWKGKFHAWLSDRSTDAISRVPDGGPWRIVNSEGALGTVAFADHDAWAGYPAVSLTNDEFGSPAPQYATPVYTWTATLLGGQHHGCACADWTTAESYVAGCASSSDDFGTWAGTRTALHGDEGWTNYTQETCDQRLSLICYQL